MAEISGDQLYRHLLHGPEDELQSQSIETLKLFKQWILTTKPQQRKIPSSLKNKITAVISTIQQSTPSTLDQIDPQIISMLVEIDNELECENKIAR